MGQILHGTATTTHRIRKEIQTSQASLKSLSEKYNINIKTVRKWKQRDFVEDLKCGSKKGYGTVLSSLEIKIICELRCKTLLPLDDLYIVLKPHIPKLSRSNLHRCLQRYRISRLKDLLPKEEQKGKKKFKDYPPGYLHIDTSEIRIKKKKYYLFVSVDRCTKYVYVEIYDNKKMDTAQVFLKNALKQYPFTITKILTDNGIEFTYELLPENKRPKDKIHLFDQVCIENGIEHRLTKFRHPWTNGQVEIINKKIKEHTTKKFYYENIKELKEHLYYYILAYNFKIKLKALKYKTPYEKIILEYKNNKDNFIKNPNQFIVGLNI